MRILRPVVLPKPLLVPTGQAQTVGSTAMAVNARSSEKRRNAHTPLCAVRMSTIAGRARSLPLTRMLPLDHPQVPPRQDDLFPGRDAEMKPRRGSESNLDDNVAPLDGLIASVTWLGGLHRYYVRKT